MHMQRIMLKICPCQGSLCVLLLLNLSSTAAGSYSEELVIAVLGLVGEWDRAAVICQY